jgi:hypothetical protein
MALVTVEPIEHRDQGQNLETCIVDRLPNLKVGQEFLIGQQAFRVAHIGRVMDCQSECEKTGMYRIKARKL